MVMTMMPMLLMITKRTTKTLPSRRTIPHIHPQPKRRVRILVMPRRLAIDSLAMVLVLVLVMRRSRLTTEIKGGRIGMEQVARGTVGEAL
jgi:hypothetical protein